MPVSVQVGLLLELTSIRSDSGKRRPLPVLEPRPLPCAGHRAGRKLQVCQVHMDEPHETLPSSQHDAMQFGCNIGVASCTPS